MRAAILILLAGCQSQFTDLRPDPQPLQMDVDAGVLDIGMVSNDTIHARGTFSGRGSYTGMGEAALVVRMNGTIALTFDASFQVSGVPGPVVVLSTRDRLGSSIDPGQGDIEVGALPRNGGAQSFEVTASALDRTYVWVFCKPFGVEIARAELTAVQ